jgi:hypothetical protein
VPDKFQNKYLGEMEHGELINYEVIETELTEDGFVYRLLGDENPETGERPVIQEFKPTRDAKGQLQDAHLGDAIEAAKERKRQKQAAAEPHESAAESADQASSAPEAEHAAPQ